MSTLSAALLGVLLVTLVASIPVIGILVTITVLIFAFGVALMTGVGADPDWVSRRFGSRRAKSTAAEEVPAGQMPAAEEPPATEPPSEEPGTEEQHPPGPPAQ